MPELPKATRAAVYARDEGRCQACGIFVMREWKSIQHRKARGTGGTNNMSNLVLMCGSATTGCHRLAENRDSVMLRRGFWVPSWLEPAAVPVERWDGTLILLNDDGTVSRA
jgi:5-methylcytosine-specific restriction endonuclease McrA